jgi:hypothetical protein
VDNRSVGVRFAVGWWEPTFFEALSTSKVMNFQADLLQFSPVISLLDLPAELLIHVFSFLGKCKQFFDFVHPIIIVPRKKNEHIENI